MLFELIKEHWIVSLIVSILTGAVGLRVPMIRTLIVAAFRAVMSEKVLKAVALDLAGWIVRSTKNKLDDKWYAQYKKDLDNS